MAKTLEIESLVMTIANSGFTLWELKDFRSLIDFDKQPQEEQDRIFNELLVTGFGLLILYLDNAVLRTKTTKNEKQFLDLQKKSIAFFLDYLSKIGIDKKLVTIWNKLIQMRLDEYRKDYKTALKQAEKSKELEKEDKTLKETWARIETVSIDCLGHIRRGKTNPDDPLWPMLRTWLIVLNNQISESKLY